MKKRGAPIGWRTATVADICQMQNGNGFGPEDWDKEGLPIIRIQNLNGGKEFDYYSGIPQERWIVEPGQLLFAWAGTRGVSFGPTVWRGTRGVLNQHIFKVNPRDSIDSAWLYWALRHVTSRIETQAHGFKATLLHVKKNDIDNQWVNVPPSDEQERIARCLELWDGAIDTTESLLANSRKQKLALLQDLILRTQHTKHWKPIPLRKIAERVQRRVQDEESEIPILMISSSRGFVRQDEKYVRYMAGKSVENYILLNKGEFAYNKGNSKLYEFGCMFPLEAFERGLVPHVYVCFAMSDQCEPQFYKYLFQADYLHDQLGALVNTGVRNNGLLNIRPNDFLGVKVPLPPLEEQRQIAAVLETATTHTKCYEQDLAALKLQKQALMQQLLTGKRRVRRPSSSSEAAA